MGYLGPFCTRRPCRLLQETGNVGALIIGIGFWGGYYGITILRSIIIIREYYSSNYSDPAH